MQLSVQELERFDTQGYVFKPSTFKEDETTLLRHAAREVHAMDRKDVWREKTAAPITAIEGDVWQRHQDYGTWACDEGVPARASFRGSTA